MGDMEAHNEISTQLVSQILRLSHWFYEYTCHRPFRKLRNWIGYGWMYDVMVTIQRLATCLYKRHYGHRIETNQKSNSRQNLSPFFFNAHVWKYTINTPFWRHPDKFPPALLTFKRHLPVTKADVLYLYTKKAGGKNCRENLIARMEYWWRRWDAWGDMREDINFKGADIEVDFWLISILSQGSHLVSFSNTSVHTCTHCVPVYFLLFIAFRAIAWWISCLCFYSRFQHSKNPYAVLLWS